MSFRVILTIVFVMFETLLSMRGRTTAGSRAVVHGPAANHSSHSRSVDKELNATYRRLTSAMDKREWRETRAKPPFISTSLDILQG